MEQTPPSTRALPALRASWGLLLLARPGLGLGLGRPAEDARERALALVLGVRELLQSAILCKRPRRGLLAAGAAVDALHALSMVALAGLRPSWRRVLAPNALASAALAAAGMHEAARAPATAMGVSPRARDEGGAAPGPRSRSVGGPLRRAGRLRGTIRRCAAPGI